MKQQAFNPYLPSYEYIPDGEPYVFGDRVYVYGSHDRFNGTMYCMNDYVCWSAPVDDLASWRYEGVIYKKDSDPLNPDGKHVLFAPDVQQGTDGRYYLYYSYDFTGIMSVAVCDTPAGEYTFLGHVQFPDGHVVGTQDGDPQMFDPGVLVDDDGRVYLYSGFAPINFPSHRFPGMKEWKREGGYLFELEPDMFTIKRGPELVFHKAGEAAGTGFEGHEFFEASSLRKIGSTYYFVYSSINGHELCYAVSDRPDGGFRYGGTIISNGDIYLNGREEKDRLNYTGNNHGSIVEINGQWYVFYHRQTNNHQFSRQACAEPITILADGSIPQVEMTSCGLNNAPLRGEGEYEARIACHLYSREGAVHYGFGGGPGEIHPCFTQDGEDRMDNPDQHIGNFCAGAVAGFKYFHMDGARRISIQTRGSAQGTVIVSTAPGGSPAAQIEITPTDTWAWFAAPLTIENGKQALYFTFRGEGSFDFLSFRLEK